MADSTTVYSQAQQEAQRSAANPEVFLNTLDRKKFEHTRISGRWDQFRSPYWGLVMSAVGIRYAIRPFTREFWKTGTQYPAEKLQGPLNYFKAYIYPAVAGLIMWAAAGYYARQTWRDMRNIFSETLAWEYNKDPKDVTFSDFRHSQNAIIKRTLGNFYKYNFRRFAINSLFFVPFVPWLGPKVFRSKLFSKLGTNHTETPLDWGVGGNSAYLVTDIIWRKETFFEKLQNFIDHKINHTDRVGEAINAADLISLYDRHVLDQNPNHVTSGRMNTPEWKNSEVLFGRAADLMNQTYGNTEAKEQANFTVPKLIYLLGEGLIDADKVQQSLTYIQIANRDGIEAVKQVADAVRKGTSFEDAAARYQPMMQLTTAAEMEPQQAAPRTIGKSTQAEMDRRAGVASPVTRDLPSEDVMGAASRAIAQRREMEQAGKGSPAAGAA